MEARNTVTVLVYGQEYTISGNMSREQIMKIADIMDGRMKEVGEGTNEPASKVAVLAGMLIADDLCTLEEIDKLKDTEIAEKTVDVQKYEGLWEEVKQNFAAYKDEMSTLNTLKDNLQVYAKEKEQQVSALSSELTQEKSNNAALRARIEELTAAAQQQADAPAEAQKHIDELENRCRDIESSFFDIQMENIHLKNEIETLRGRR